MTLENIRNAPDLTFDGRRAGTVAALGLTAALTFVPAIADAQTPLGQPNASFPEDFGSIQSVRELADGRVLVADPLGRELYLVDMDAGTRQVVGRQGQGPDEYMQPDAVWPLPGDSTLLVDLGNGRLVSIGPDLRFGPTMPIASGDPRPGQGAAFSLALPQAVDAEGRIYTRALGMGGGPGGGGALPDSGGVLRIDRATRTSETAATVKLQERISRTTGGANDRNVSIESVPLSPEDAWGVAPDGAVVVARAGDARVEWIEPSGRVVRGPAVAGGQLPIRTAEKEEWLRDQARSGGGVAVMMSIENGAVSTNLSRGGAQPGGGRQREVDQYTWPDRTPPFRSGRVPVDPLGRAWVARHVPAGGPSTYDVFDRTGTRVATYTLTAGTRVIGFGEGSVYAVSYDDFDLNYLERYSLPQP
jgi:hypothetical protein